MSLLKDLSWALRVAGAYKVTAAIPYRAAEGVDVKLDVYEPWTTAAPRPTLMFMHGGGWMADSTKETWALWFLPFLQLGWVVVNVDYRPSSVAAAPAAVEDCWCALKWIGCNAERHSMHLEQLVIAGLSSGGHLALMTGLAPSEATQSARPGLRSPSDSMPRAAAIVNWCGITDVADLLEGPHLQEFAIRWVGEQPDGSSVATSVSPLTYAGKGSPPVITVHGDSDDIVPYSHAVRLHRALEGAGVPNELITVPGGKHASLGAYLGAYPQVFKFIEQAGVKLDCGHLGQTLIEKPWSAPAGNPAR